MRNQSLFKLNDSTDLHLKYYCHIIAIKCNQLYFNRIKSFNLEVCDARAYISNYDIWYRNVIFSNWFLLAIITPIYKWPVPKIKDHLFVFIIFWNLKHKLFSFNNFVQRRRYVRFNFTMYVYQPDMWWIDIIQRYDEMSHLNIVRSRSVSNIAYTHFQKYVACLRHHIYACCQKTQNIRTPKFKIKTQTTVNKTLVLFLIQHISRSVIVYLRQLILSVYVAWWSRLVEVFK